MTTMARFNCDLFTFGFLVYVTCDKSSFEKDEFVDLEILFQDMETTVVSGSGTETGQIIVTSIGGQNGQPKQVD